MKHKERQGKIQFLERQKPFRLHCLGGHHITTYRTDFVYIENGKRIVEDAKGHLTKRYIMLRKWMLLEHKISIRETYKAKPWTW